MKLGILLLFGLICCFYSTPASALALSTAPTFGSVVLQNYPPEKSTMARDSTVQTPEKHLKLANKSLRSGIFALLFMILTIAILEVALGFTIAFLLGIICALRAIILGVKAFKRTKADDSVSRKARRRAIAGVILGANLSILLFFLLYILILLSQ